MNLQPVAPGDRYVPWLSQCQINWHFKPIKYLCALNARVLPEDTDPDEGITYIDIGSVNSNGTWEASELMPFSEAPSRARRVLVDGDVLISTVRTYLRAITNVGKVNGNLICSTGFAVLSAGKTVDPRFLAYWVRSAYFIDEIVARSVGVSYPAINASDIGNLPFPTIPPKDQRTIAVFLDRATERIDGLIAKKQRQIELLQEKRAALISHVVTKGLNPNAKMKDSGVEWLGEIPQGWEVLTLRRVATRIQTGSTPPTEQEHYYNEGTIPWYGPGSFGVDLVLDNPVKFIAEEAVNNGVARLFSCGSTMIVGIGATIGKVGYIEHDASCNQQITVVTFSKDRTLGKFAAYQLKRLEPVLQGIAPSSTLPIMDQQRIGDLPLALPDIQEQVEVVTYIDDETKKIDVIVGKEKESIETLREYRTALISAAVTGKIDVRQEVST